MQTFDIHLGRPVIRGALTIFPIWNGAAVAQPGYDVRHADLTVEERSGTPVVGELVVTNAGRRPALILEGELLEGGQQHRLAARSTLLSPGESQILHVRCVEQGRWDGQRTHVRTGRRAPISVRSAAQQYGTWERIAALENRHGGGATHFLGDALRSVDDQAARLVGGLKPLPFQSGVLLCISGRPIQLEVFDSPGTLATAWSALLHAAAVDALDAALVATPGYRARRFVDHVRHVADTEISDAESESSPVTRRSRETGLTTLSWRGRIVHAVAINRRHELVNA